MKTFETHGYILTTIDQFFRYLKKTVTSIIRTVYR